MNSWPSSTPVISDDFADIYSNIRKFKTEFKSRFELDHYFDGTLDTSNPGCEGYHKKVTMPHWNAEEYETEYPARPDDSVVFFAKKFSTSATASFTSGSADITLTVTAASLGLVVGMLIEGDSTYLEDGTFISSINGSVVTMSKLAKATIAALVIAFSTIELCCEKDDGTYQMTNNNEIATNLEDDGTFLYPAGPGRYKWIAYGNNIYVLTYGKYIYSSTDGKTWTLRLTSSSANDIFRVVFNNGIFVAVGGWMDNVSGSGILIYSSTDGISWAQRINYTGINSYACSLKVVNNKFICGISTSTLNINTRIYVSDDGIAWNLYTKSGGAIALDFCYFDGYYYVITNYYLFKYDSSFNYIKTCMSFGSGNDGWCCNDDSAVYIYAGNTKILYRSTDGETFTQVLSVATSDSFYGIIKTNESLILYGSIVYNSIDGTTWNKSDLPVVVTKSSCDIAIYNNIVVLTDYNIYISSDYGKTFTLLHERTSSTDACGGVIYNNVDDVFALGGKYILTKYKLLE